MVAQKDVCKTSTVIYYINVLDHVGYMRVC